MKNLSILVPAFAVALTLTACGELPQPAVPETPVSVEKALEKAMDKENMTEEEAGKALEDAGLEDEVLVDVDADLEAVAEELDAAAEAVTEESTQELGEEMPTVPEALADTPELGTENNEDELIDQPIIIE